MSKWATERWDAELFLDPQWIVLTNKATTQVSDVLCMTSHGDDEAKAKQIASDTTPASASKTPSKPCRSWWRQPGDAMRRSQDCWATKR